MYDYAHVVAEKAAADGTPFRVIIEPDLDRTDLNPRDDYSNAGVIYVIDQRRYVVPQEADDVPGIDAAIIDHDFRVVARWLRIFHGATAVLPLYSAYGQDFNIAAGELDETPRAGDYIGVTFDTGQTRRDTIGVDLITADEVGIMARAMAADVETYRRWAEGDVWGHIVQRADLDGDVDVDVAAWVEADEGSCWGFIGQQWAEEAAEEALDSVVSVYDDEVAARLAQNAADAAEIDDLRRVELGTPR